MRRGIGVKRETTSRKREGLLTFLLTIALHDIDTGIKRHYRQLLLFVCVFVSGRLKVNVAQDRGFAIVH
jgi:hypothetical protein